MASFRIYSEEFGTIDAAFETLARGFSNLVPAVTQTAQHLKEDAMNIVTSIPESDLAASKQAAYKPLFKRPPSFETLEQERQHRKERLAAGFRIFGALGFSEGVAGISRRAIRNSPTHSGSIRSACISRISRSRT